MSYKVSLSHAPNPDLRRGYWSGIPKCKGMLIEVRDFIDASAACLQYITKYDLGGGNWTGGRIYDHVGTHVATVSYNGKVWDASGDEGDRLLYSPYESDAATLRKTAVGME